MQSLRQLKLSPIVKTPFHFYENTFFGIYDKQDPVNARTRILLDGIKKTGWEMQECASSATSFRRFWVLFKKYRKIAKYFDYDVMFLAYGGAQTVSLLAKILSPTNLFSTASKKLVDSFEEEYSRLELIPLEK